MKSMFATVFAAAFAIASAPSVEAKGCIKGAIVGGAAGHMAGHGKLGAAACECRQLKLGRSDGEVHQEWRVNR